MPPIPQQTLTHVELEGLRAAHNLADGHAHQPLSKAQLRVIANLPDIFSRAGEMAMDEVETRFREVFFEQQHQSHKAFGPAQILYSASIAIHAVARFLAESSHVVGLVTPTFDNIPDLLRAQRLQPVPLSEADVLDPKAWNLRNISALFLVVPNNPTGWTLSSTQWRTLIADVVRSNVLLIVDFSFRYFSQDRTDVYKMAYEAGAKFIAIEDTGKFLSALDMKVGLLAADAVSDAALRRIVEDLLLNVSPFVLQVLAHLIHADDRDSTLNIIAGNRAILAEAMKTTGMIPIGVTPTFSVEWLSGAAHNVDVNSLLERWGNAGVVVLPGGPFAWHDPAVAASYVRIALSRRREVFQAAINQLIALTHE